MKIFFEEFKVQNFFFWFSLNQAVGFTVGWFDRHPSAISLLFSVFLYQKIYPKKEGKN
jgi:hypothetical protein